MMIKNRAKERSEFCLFVILSCMVCDTCSYLRPGKRRQVKNQKFGFGGQKKRSKYNTAESSAEMGKKKKGPQNGPVRKFQGVSSVAFNLHSKPFILSFTGE